MARIFAKAVNCERPEAGEPCNECPACQRIGRGISLDVLEIDGASNRGIEQIRQLREEVNFVPAEVRYKVYIIDEVHMLTNEAFNALLKTLEEPPRRVIFLFATTEPHKLPPTVASRCQAFEFKNIPPELIARKLQEISRAEGIEVSAQALRAIARRAKGSFRDAEVLLEQLASYKSEGRIEEGDLLQVLGLPREEALAGYLKATLARDAPAALEVIAALSEAGKDPELFLESAVELCRDLLIARLGRGEPRGLPELDCSNDELVFLSDRLLQLKREVRFLLDKRIMLEVGTLRIIEGLKGLGPRAGSSPAASQPRANPLKSPPRAASPGEPDEKWRLMLEEIKQERVAVYAFLAESRPSFREGRLCIEYAPDYRFHKESLEKSENRSFLLEMVRKFYGDLAVEIGFGAQASAGTDQKRSQLHQKVELIKRSFHGKLVG